MDLTQIVPAIVSAVIGIGTVSAFLGKYVNKALGYARLAQDATSTLEDVLTALQDNKLTPEEVAKLQTDVATFKAHLSAL